MGLKSIFMFTRIVRWCVAGFFLLLYYCIQQAGCCMFFLLLLLLFYVICCFALYCMLLIWESFVPIYLCLLIQSSFLKKRLVVDLCFQVQVHECVFYCWYLF